MDTRLRNKSYLQSGDNHITDDILTFESKHPGTDYWHPDSYQDSLHAASDIMAHFDPKMSFSGKPYF